MFRVIEQCLLTTLYMHLLLNLDLPSRSVCLMRLCIAIPVSERNSMSQTAGTQLGCAGERYDATFLATEYLDRIVIIVVTIYILACPVDLST